MVDKIRTVLLIVGTSIIIFAIYFFMFIRGFFLSITSIVIIITCLVLMYFTKYTDKSINLFFGMEIEKMELSNAQHYHSMITNIMIGFSAIVGVIVTLVWSSKGEIWRTNNVWFFMFLFPYFNLVMYFVFLKKLRGQIVKQNKNRIKR